LERVEADEHGIRRKQNVLMSRDPRLLPGEFHRIDEDESGRRSSAASSWVMGSAAKPATSANVDACSGIAAGESSAAGAVVTKAKYRRVWWPIVTVMLGVREMCRMGVLLSLNAIQNCPTIT
jgi:hypothetical protein